MSKKKRLGRGLEALLGVGKSDENGGEPAVSNDKPGEKTPTKLELESNSEKIETLADLQDDTSDNDSNENAPTILPFKSVKTDVVKSASKTIEATDSTVRKPTSVKAAKASLSSDSVPVGEPRSVGKKIETEDQVQGIKSSVGSTLKESDKSGINLKTKDQNTESSNVRQISVFEIEDNPFQPRREFNKAEVDSLAESLKSHDQLQPILVRQIGDRFQLISGERRLRAAKQAGWTKISAQIRVADDRLVAELAIVENLQRKDLNPIEKALSFRRYLDEHKCSQDDLAGRLKIDRTTVTNLLRLLELPAAVQKSLQVGLISNGHARALLPLGEEHLQIENCNRIQREGLSVRATEQLVREIIDKEDGVATKSATKSRTKSSQVVSLEKKLQHSLGTKVEINANGRGRGKIVIHYANREEFQRLFDEFSGSTGSADAA